MDVLKYVFTQAWWRGEAKAGSSVYLGLFGRQVIGKYVFREKAQ